MAGTAKILPYYTYNDWLHWEGQWELIDGIPHAMSPMPVPKHQQIANALGGEFYQALKSCKNCKTFQAIDYKISNDTILQPDVLVVCKPINKKYLDFSPHLVIEILSPSTALKDRHTKFKIYEEQQIKYYLIVSADKEEVEIYKLESGTYQPQKTEREDIYSFSLNDDCHATIDFKEIW